MSDENIDEGIIQLAYAVNVGRDRTSEGKLRRYSSINSVLGDFSDSRNGSYKFGTDPTRSGGAAAPVSTSDPSMHVLAGVANPFNRSMNTINSSTDKYGSNAGVNGSASGSGAGSGSARSIGGTLSRPAVVQTRDARRPPPDVYRPNLDVRKVSDRAEVSKAIYKGPSIAATSSYAVTQDDYDSTVSNFWNH
jgi:hypothetical protein